MGGYAGNVGSMTNCFAQRRVGWLRRMWCSSRRRFAVGYLGGSDCSAISAIEQPGLSEAKMKVAVEKIRSAREPYLQVHREQILAMMLRPGSVEVGPRRSEMRRVTFQAGELGVFPRHAKT